MMLGNNFPPPQNTGSPFKDMNLKKQIYPLTVLEGRGPKAGYEQAMSHVSMGKPVLHPALFSLLQLKVFFGL